MGVAPRREAGIYLADIKAPQMLLQHTAPSFHQLHKPDDRQSYLSPQFIPWIKCSSFPSYKCCECGMDCPCFQGELLASSVRRNHCVTRTHDMLQCLDLEIVSCLVAQQHPEKSWCCLEEKRSRLSCQALPSVIKELPPFPGPPCSAPAWQEARSATTARLVQQQLWDPLRRWRAGSI